MCFSRKTIQQTLEVTSEEGELPQIVETESSSGPGSYNFFQYLQYRNDMFVVSAQSDLKNFRNKVIICDPLLRDRPLHYIEAEYFYSLIEHYDAYFWNGTDNPVLGSDRLLTDKSFMNKRSQLTPATKKEVIHGLGIQGLAIDDFIILDHEGLNIAMYKLYMRSRDMTIPYIDSVFISYKTSFFLQRQKPGQLNLEWYDDIIHLDEIAHHINADTITTITISMIYPEDAKKILNLFKNLETIVVLLPTKDFIENSLPIFSNKNVILYCQMYEYSRSELILPHNCNIKTLTLVTQRHLSFGAASGAQVENLVIAQQRIDPLKRFDWPGRFDINVGMLPTLQNIDILFDKKRKEEAHIKTSDKNRIKCITYKTQDTELLITNLFIDHPSRVEMLRSVFSTHWDLDRNDDTFLNWCEETRNAVITYSKKVFSLNIKKYERMITNENKAYHFIATPGEDNSPVVSVKKLYLKQQSFGPSNLNFINVDTGIENDYSLMLPENFPLIPIHNSPEQEKFILEDDLRPFEEFKCLALEDLNVESIVIDISRFQLANVTIPIKLKNCPNLKSVLAFCPNQQVKIEEIEGCPNLKRFYVKARKLEYSVDVKPQNNLIFEQAIAVGKEKIAFVFEVKEDAPHREDDAPNTLYFKNTKGYAESGATSCGLYLKMFLAAALTADLIYLYLNFNAVLALATASATFILAHPIILMVAGSLTLCALAFVLYNTFKTVKPSVIPYKVDSQTKLDSLTREKKGAISAIKIYDGETKEECHHDDFRSIVYTDCVVKGKNITLINKPGKREPIAIPVHSINTQEKETKYTELQKTTKLDEYLVFNEGTFKPDTWYPLTSQQAIIKKEDLSAVYCNSSSIQFEWDDNSQQIYFKCSGFFSQDILLFCRIKKHHTQSEQFIFSPLSYTNRFLMKEATKRFSQKFIDNFKLMLSEKLKDINYIDQPNLKHLSFFLDENQTPEDRIHHLYTFCSHFAWYSDLENPPENNDDMETMIEIIMQCRGVCRHRSYAFTLLCQVYGFDCHFIGNADDHAFPELRFVDTNGDIYSKRVVITSPYEFPNAPFAAANESTYAKTPEPQESQESKESKLAFNKYYNILKKAVAYEELDSIDKIIPQQLNESKAQEQKKAPLLLLKSDQTPLEANAAIVKQLKNRHFNTLENHLFINNAADFPCFLSPGKIVNGQRVREHNGPLRKLLTNNSDQTVLVINGENFSETERAAYQTTIDQDPPPQITIQGETFLIPKNMKVMWLMKESTDVDEAFLSRAKPFRVPYDFLDNSILPAADEEKAIPVNIFQTTAYEECVFGPLDLNGKELQHVEGPFLQAIKNKCPLIVSNPPNTERFKLFMHQVNAEKKVMLLNGKMEPIPDEVYIQVADKPLEVSQPNNVRLQCENLDNEKKETREKIYLGVHNFHELYKIVSINENTHEAHTDKNGLLGSYNPDTHVFYITGDIPLSYWQRLISVITQYHSEKQFNFVLAPNASIQTIRKNEVLNKNKTTSTYITNDPDCLAEEIALESKDSIIIDVNRNKSFNQLIGEIHQSKDGFTVTHGLVLNALDEGRTVILNGEISFAFYQQLLPLLSPKPHILFNGKHIPINGKLILVMPEKVKNKMRLLSYQDKTYELADYKNYFKDRETDFNKITLFYEKLNALPHRGPGRPEKPYISLKRIKTMMDALQNKVLHPHNPIKSIFNADYPSDSRDYCYLNVMGKAIFRSEDVTPARSNKLAHYLHETPEQVKENLWKILNCFNGADIFSILGDNFTIVENEGFPSIDDDAVERLMNKIQLVTQQKEQKRDRHQKQMDELHYYLKQKTPPIIILQGPAGVGKTHAVRQLLGKDAAENDNFYEGEEGLIKWLESNGDKPFLADEMNMTNDWDFLEGLGRSDKTVVYRGKSYKLDRHQVIGTCNPVGPQYPDRVFVKVIQNLAATVAFKTPSDDFYKNKVLLPKLNRFSDSEKTRIMNMFIYAYHLTQKYNPHIVRSIRDIENVAERFIYLSLQKDKSLDTILIEACLGEFSGSIHGIEKRQQFEEDIKNYLKPKMMADEKSIQNETENKSAPECKLIKLTDKISITDPKEYFVNAVMQDLGMRWHALLNRELEKHKLAKESHEKEEKSSLPYYKQSVTVEGEAGGGKSVCLRAIVQKHIAELTAHRDKLQLQLQTNSSSFTEEMKIELQLLNKELSKKIYAVSGGSSNPEGELKEAFHNECIIIIDECNLNPAADRLVSQFLCGVDENMQPVSYPGFMYLGSQNSTAYGGRPTISKSKQNRDHMIYMDGFTDAELTRFAEEQVEYPEAYVEAYHKIREEYPHANMRTFHEVSKEIARMETMAQAQKTPLPRVASHSLLTNTSSSSLIPPASPSHQKKVG